MNESTAARASESILRRDAAAFDQPPGAIDGRWARAVVRFNLQPAEYADASWLPRWAPLAAPRARQELSRGLLREHGLETLCDWALDDAAARLFMMDADAFDSISLAVGVAAHRDSLRQVVRKDRLTALRECLGQAASALWLSVAESVPRAAAALIIGWEPLDAQALKSKLTDTGKAALLRMLDPTEPRQRAAALRCALRLPRPASAQGELALPPLPLSQAERMAEAIVRDLLPRWAPQWTWLF